jgi:hypothetical protein
MGSNSSLFVDAKTITTGGTSQVLLAPSVAESGVGSVVIKARKGNTVALYLGNATTGGGTNGSGLTATTGFELQPGDSVSIDILGLGRAYIFCATTGQAYDVLSIGA